MTRTPVVFTDDNDCPVAIDVSKVERIHHALHQPDGPGTPQVPKDGLLALVFDDGSVTFVKTSFSAAVDAVFGKDVPNVA